MERKSRARFERLNRRSTQVRFEIQSESKERWICWIVFLIDFLLPFRESRKTALKHFKTLTEVLVVNENQIRPMILKPKQKLKLTSELRLLIVEQRQPRPPHILGEINIHQISRRYLIFKLCPLRRIFHSDSFLDFCDFKWYTGDSFYRHHIISFSQFQRKSDKFYRAAQWEWVLLKCFKSKIFRNLKPVKTLNNQSDVLASSGDMSNPMARRRSRPNRRPTGPVMPEDLQVHSCSKRLFT